jgi:PAS domain S-box-containing protein
MLRNLPIRRKLMAILLLTSGSVLLLTCLSFITYEFVSFRRNMVSNIATLSNVVATNSTAALAFDNQSDAREILTALKADPHIVAAALYDSQGRLFAIYPADLSPTSLPAAPASDGYHFQDAHLVGFAPVREGDNKRLGTLYVSADETALYTQLLLYSAIAGAMTALAFLVAYLLSRSLQAQISMPLLALADTASAVSTHHDYAARATKFGTDEIGSLTDAFNQMLAQIQEQDRDVRNSEARLRAVLNSALSAVIVIDRDSKVVDWNPRAQDTFGWARDQALGRDLAELIIPVHLRESHHRGMQQYLETGVAPAFNRLLELSAMRRDGTEFPVEVSISPLGSMDAPTFCGFITDISERKQAEGKLQAQLHRLDLLHRITRAIGERQSLESIFQTVTRSLEQRLPVDFACICMYDSAMRTLTVNTVGEQSQRLAVTTSMQRGTEINVDTYGLERCIHGEFISEADLANTPSPIAQRLAAQGLRSLAIAPLLAESKVVGALIAAKNVIDGFSSSDCEFLAQLSEHTALAAHHMQLYIDLEKAYQDLRQSQQTMLQQERLRALGQMASGVAHDINNAISPIALYTESLLEHEPGLSERARTYLQTIQRAIDDVARTVSRMREFYRPRELEITRSLLQLNEIARQVVELTRVRWQNLPQERGVEIALRLELDAELPEVMGADNEIRDALTNLIFNAVDAMPSGGALIVRTYRSVLTRSESRDTAAVAALEVVDSGTGMDEETRQHCLEPFYTTKGERGTGLGLAMVYGMTQRHHAELQIDSTPGIGTTVRVLFAVDPSGGESVAKYPTQGAQLPAMNLLVIDDDALIAESLYEVLRRDGHQVTTRDNGQAGIDAFMEAVSQMKPFDAVITDLGMPRVDGRRVATAVKTLAPDTTVILLTGWGQRLLDDHEVPAHVDRVLGKPPKMEELRRALTELVAPRLAGEVTQR